MRRGSPTARRLDESAGLQFCESGIDLAGPELYASFVAIDGSTLDRGVDGLGTLNLTLETLPLDSDNDGIPDPVEIAWFGNLTTANATSDTDGDGSRDLDEWIGGTSAADPKSVTLTAASMMTRWSPQ